MLWNQIRSHLRVIAMEQFHISVEQFHVLRIIRKGYTSVSEIADARRISRPAVSQAVENLVEKGLITRRQVKNDRRFVHLELTPAGGDLLDQVFQQNRAWMKQKMAFLSAEDLSQITEALTSLKLAYDEPKQKIQEETIPPIGME
jgi:DNA-binding MarR family transcriptional regulator